MALCRRPCLLLTASRRKNIFVATTVAGFIERGPSILATSESEHTQGAS